MITYPARVVRFLTDQRIQHTVRVDEGPLDNINAHENTKVLCRLQIRISSSNESVALTMCIAGVVGCTCVLHIKNWKCDMVLHLSRQVALANT